MLTCSSWVIEAAYNLPNESWSANNSNLRLKGMRFYIDSQPAIVLGYLSEEWHFSILKTTNVIKVTTLLQFLTQDVNR